MAQQFTYDEKGSTFLYFLLSVFVMILIPLTYFVWPKSLKEEEKRLLKMSQVHGKSKWYKKLHDELQAKKRKPSFRKIFLLLCWVAFAVLVYKVSHIENEYVEYDPYEVLGVDREVTKAELKKKFRQLSLEFHPDKGGDPELFMKMRKAYEALTDEETMENWKNYGNPDGPRAVEVGIALPKWIVESKNSVFVMGIYMLIFMVVMPIIVGMWWNRSIKYSKEEVLLHTTQLYYYFFNKTPNMQLKRVILVLSGSFEFSRDYTTKVRAPAPSDNKDIPELMRSLESFSISENAKERPLNFPYSVKARALIYSNLCRIEISSPLLNSDLEYILTKTPLLIQEMVSCISQLTSMAHYKKAALPRLVTLENVMKLCPMMVQGLRESKSPLLQLPYFNDEFVRNCHFCKKRSIRSLSALAGMAESDRRLMLRRMGDEEYETMIAVLNQFPYVKLNASTMVIDDEETDVITAGSLVTVNLCLTRKVLGDLRKNASARGSEKRDEVVDEPKEKPTPKTKPHERSKKKGRFGRKIVQKPEASKALDNITNKTELNNSQKILDTPSTQDNKNLSDSENEKENQIENNDDDDEIEWQKMQASLKQENATTVSSKQTHTVYAPMFPIEKQEWWWAYICDQRHHLLITNPILVTNLVDETNIELKFPAPQKPGRYTYTICVRSDSYLDCDKQTEIKLDVKEAKPIDEDHPQWNISDDEDKEDGDSEDEGISSDDLSLSDEE